MNSGTSIPQEDERCGVDLPPAGEANYCPCQRPPNHDGPHQFQGLSWPQGSNDPGAIWKVKRG